MTFIRQWYLLTSRHLWVLWEESANVFWLVGQVPVIAMLIILCFSGYAKEDAALDFFSRFTHHSGIYVSQREQVGDTVVIDKTRGAELYDISSNESQMIGIGSAQRRAAVYYSLVSAALWFGMMGSCKEIAGERYVLQRESRTCYGVGPYLASKFTIQVLIVGIQTGLLALAAPYLLQMSWNSTLGLMLILWLTAVAAVGMGLLLSASCNSVRSALTWVPMLMIPQFLFGGLLKPLPMASHSAPPVVMQQQDSNDPMTMASSIASCVVVQRWAFDASMALDEQYAQGGVLRLQFDWPNVAPDSPSWAARDMLRLVRDKECTLADTILPLQTPLDHLVGLDINDVDLQHRWEKRFVRAVGVLGAMIISLLLCTYAVLWGKYQ